MLSKGLIRRIGPRDVAVWEDNWIPGLRSLKPLVRAPGSTVERVNDLFIPGTRVWDEEAVNRSFMGVEAVTEPPS